MERRLSCWVRAAVASSPVRQEVIVSGTLGVLVSTLIVGAVPAGGDAAAHLYRTLLVHGGTFIWDNLWFSGHYPLASYSFLYYLLANAVGNLPLSVAAVIATAVLFAVLVVGEWGRAARWPARIFAVLCGGQLFTGAFDYTVGFAMLLATLVLIQRGRNRSAMLGSVATIAISPLAFLFLCVVLVAVWIPRHRLTWSTGRIAATLGVCAIAELVLQHVFPSPGMYYPFGTWRLLVVLAVSALGIALALQSRERMGSRIASLFLVWALTSIVAAAVPSPVGHNVTRLSTAVLPLMLLASTLAGFRPRWLVALALGGATAIAVGPYLSMIPQRTSAAGSTAAYWEPAISFLRTHSSPQFRVEVVPTNNHWEAYYLPKSGIELARGWYRQLDIADNPALYRPTLTAAAYRHWLRGVAVKYVVVTDLQPAAMGAPREAALVSSGRAGLRRVYASHVFTIYELPHATPILSGSAPIELTAVGHLAISGWNARPGSYTLRIHYLPYWKSASGACVAPAAGGMSRLVLRTAGRFTLRIDPSITNLADTVLDNHAGRCSTS